MGEASKEASDIARRFFSSSDTHLGLIGEELALAIDAHTASKDAEIERWKREAMAVREAEQRGQVFNERFFWAVNMTHGDRAKIEAARAANGATP